MITLYNYIITYLKYATYVSEILQFILFSLNFIDFEIFIIYYNFDVFKKLLIYILTSKNF